MAMSSFERNRSMTISCPRCRNRLLVTEWMTALECSCRNHLDAIDLLFECSAQGYPPRSARPTHTQPS